MAHSEGLSQSELARRSTIHRDLPDLPKHIYRARDLEHSLNLEQAGQQRKRLPQAA
jgi:hypothetical protein